MDEQAMPILLAWRLGPAVYNALWPKIALTADYILRTGPWTYQDRWEEDSGYSPSTIAAEVAGLVAAARIAEDNVDNARAGSYLAAADYWQQNVTHWTYTSSGACPHQSSEQEQNRKLWRRRAKLRAHQLSPTLVRPFS